MTLEERIAQLEQELAQSKAEGEKLGENIRNQNSYITKLEKDRKAAPETNESLDPTIKSYIQKRMRDDAISQAIKDLTPQFKPGVIGAIQPDLVKFLESTMRPEATTVPVVKEAFYLCYGKALGNPSHEIHNVIKEEIPASQEVIQQTVNQPTAEERLRSFNPNPSMAPDVQTPPAVLPGSQGIAPANTQEALKNFKNKLGSGLN